MANNDPLDLLVSRIASNEDITNGTFVFCPGYPDLSEATKIRDSFKRKTDAEYNRKVDPYDITFERKHVKDIIHIITAEIKRKGTKIPLLILPFRPDQYDADLQKFLNAAFSNGMPISSNKLEILIKDTNANVLMAALKFLWCRLPGNAIIGWKVYTKFVKLEEEANFPNKAFLDFMPTCLSSGAHASIVYDFFDLIVALIINSKKNYMSAKKLSKVCGLWAFHPIRNGPTGLPSFERGLYEWIPAGDAMYHLLLAFLKAMPPGGDLSRLPKSFQALLKSSDYPPPSTSSSLEMMKTLQEIPMITIKANNPSNNPADLLSRVVKTLTFNDPTLFYTREDFLLLKRLFNDENVDKKLSPEGTRIIENLCLRDEDSISDGKSNSGLKYKLISGWSNDMTRPSKNPLPDFFSAAVGRVSVDDFFIWTWLASMGPEETNLKKQTFGKTYILEAELAEGFKKWVIVEEQDVERDGYDIEIELKQEQLKELEAKINQAKIEAEKAKLKAEEIKKIKERKTNATPPPLPQKDYIEPEIPVRSKDKKIPIIKTTAGTITSEDCKKSQPISPAAKVPSRSPKRGTTDNQELDLSTEYLRAQQAYANGAYSDPYWSSDQPVRISLATNLDDDFLKDEFFKVDVSSRRSPIEENHQKMVGSTSPMASSPVKSQNGTYPMDTVMAQQQYQASHELIHNNENNYQHMEFVSPPRQHSSSPKMNSVVNNSPFISRSPIMGEKTDHSARGQVLTSPRPYSQSPNLKSRDTFSPQLTSPIKDSTLSQSTSRTYVSALSKPEMGSIPNLQPPADTYEEYNTEPQPEIKISGPGDDDSNYVDLAQNEVVNVSSNKRYSKQGKKSNRSSKRKSEIFTEIDKLETDLQDCLGELKISESFKVGIDSVVSNDNSNGNSNSVSPSAENLPLVPVELSYQKSPSKFLPEPSEDTSGRNLVHENIRAPNKGFNKRYEQPQHIQHNAAISVDSSIIASSSVYSEISNNVPYGRVSTNKTHYTDQQQKMNHQNPGRRNVSNSSKHSGDPILHVSRHQLNPPPSQSIPPVQYKNQNGQRPLKNGSFQNSVHHAQPANVQGSHSQSPFMQNGGTFSPPQKNHKGQPDQSPRIKQKTHQVSPPGSQQALGYPPHGYPPHGYPPSQGYPPQGYPPQGYPPQVYPPQGYPPHGYPPHGYPPKGYPPYAPKGYPVQGLHPQGPPLRGGAKQVSPPRVIPGYSPNTSSPSIGHSSQSLNTAGTIPGHVQASPSPPQPSSNGPAAGTYTANIINNMPPPGKFNKLHGQIAVNKKNARSAFMGGDFGI